MSELINLFAKLSEFYDRNLLWEQIEDIFNDETKKSNFTSLPAVETALENPCVLATLLELCTTLRNLRCESSDCDNTYDTWEQVHHFSSRDSYLAFIYALAGLATLDSTLASYKLSLAAVNTYFLSLTIPGAKGFHIFDENVVIHCLQVFTLVERIQNPEVLRHMSCQPVEIYVRFTIFCDDLKLLLRYVHFGSHKSTRDALLKKLMEIQYLNYEHGYANHYAANLHAKCFEIFEEVINAHNGEPEESLLKLMNMSVYLHTYPPRPKSNHNSSADQQREDHISDWFIKCIPKYPRLLVKVLAFYIECIVTNPIKTWKTEQTQRALEYAAKYDAALFTKCNESCVQFLCDAICADDAMIRSRVIELIARILQLDSQVDWQMFRHEVSTIPREVFLIKELIEALQDNNNNIKLKAVQALHNALAKGSPNAQKIISEGMRYARFSEVDVVLPDEPRVSKNEIRYQKPNTLQPDYTFTGHELLTLSFMNLPEFVFVHLYQNPLSYLRRAGVLFMEQLVRLNPLIIFNTNFVTETTRLVVEPTALVRKQTLNSVDALLGNYPNCYHMIWVWCKIIAPMLSDPDAKNIELAMECFRSRVLLNMMSIDQSNKAEHFMPWVIIRTLLTTQSRLYLQTCFHMALQQRMVTTQTLGVIESHLLTTNSTEAWVVLNFISGGKVKSKEPDALIHNFISMQSWNNETNMSIALEVLENCIGDFSHSALNHAFTHILGSIRQGNMLPSLSAKAFDFLILIDDRSTLLGSRICKEGIAASSNRNANDTDREHWVTELHDLLEGHILAGIRDFPDNRFTLMSYLFNYSEASLHARLRPPHTTIVAFVHRYMSECLRLPEADLNLESEQLFNLMTLLAGRFSLRDACVANTTCTLYGAILKAIDRPPIVNTVVVALIDVCKKHTHIVERIIERVLHKLSSPFAVNRLETFKCFEKLILQDQLKLRGSLLVALLAALLDESSEVATRARNFFTEYRKKTPTFFQKCLIQCPFIFNEYKNFDGFYNFAEGTIKSPLASEAKCRSRQLLYDHLMAEIDEISLLLYFGQLKLVAEKSQRDPLMKTTTGVALVKDVLFILQRVCQLTKQQQNNADGPTDHDEEMVDVADAVPMAPSDHGGRKRREVTMPEALSQLEKSLIFIATIHEHMHDYDTSLEQCFDDLNSELAKRFPMLIEFALPAHFWNKYRTAKYTAVQSSGGGLRKTATKRKAHSSAGDQQQPQVPTTVNAEDASDLVHNCTKETNTMLPNRSAATKSAELPFKYLFQPKI